MLSDYKINNIILISYQLYKLLLLLFTNGLFIGTVWRKIVFNNCFVAYIKGRFLLVYFSTISSF